MRLSEQINGHELWLTKLVRDRLADLMVGHRLHRLEAVALAESRMNQAWLEVLGFRREENGTAQAFTADRRDAIRYEFIRR